MEKQAHNVQLEANEGKAGVHCQLNRTHGREKKKRRQNCDFTTQTFDLFVLSGRLSVFCESTFSYSV